MQTGPRDNILCCHISFRSGVLVMLTLKVGDLFAGCRILDLCGQGGCGSVYLAEDAVGERVAIKIIHTPDRDRELRGVQAYMAVMKQSAHLLQLRHVGIEQDTLFYIMPACDPCPGVPKYLPDTLGTRLKSRGRLDPEFDRYEAEIQAVLARE